MTVCQCVETGAQLHRRAVASVEVSWTDVEGCACPAGVVLLRGPGDAGAARELAASLEEAADLMARVDAADAAEPGSPERAAIHDEGCVSHRCHALLEKPAHQVLIEEGASR